MSVTYSIGCSKCKCHLWIGQSSLSPTFRLYTAKEYTDSLQNFLWEHRRHPLVFDENCESEMSVERWLEIEAKSNAVLDYEKEYGGEPTITWDDCAHNLANALGIDFAMAKRMVRDGFHSVGALEGTIERDFTDMGFTKHEAAIILTAVENKEKKL
jgi:hypothetical protein